MLALIRFSDKFYLVVPKQFFIPLICPTDISTTSLKAHLNPVRTLYKSRVLTWDFVVCSYNYLSTQLAPELIEAGARCYINKGKKKLQLSAQ